MPVARTLKVFLGSPRRPKLGLLDEGTVAFRVWPGDLDSNLHMNNGRYLTLMDLGRFDLLARAGALPILRRRRWYPVVGSATIRYRRSLEPFQRYEMRTRVLGWDEKWVYLEQRFVRNGEVAAVGVIKALFRGASGNVPTKELLGEFGVAADARKLPDAVAQWTEAERALTA